MYCILCIVLMYCQFYDSYWACLFHDWSVSRSNPYEYLIHDTSLQKIYLFHGILNLHQEPLLVPRWLVSRWCGRQALRGGRHHKATDTVRQPAKKASGWWRQAAAARHLAAAGGWPAGRPGGRRAGGKARMGGRRGRTGGWPAGRPGGRRAGGKTRVGGRRAGGKTRVGGRRGRTGRWPARWTGGQSGRPVIGSEILSVEHDYVHRYK